MTNLIAAVIITVSTNWCSIGTFTPKQGASEDVQEARLVTNTVAIVEWKGREQRYTLEVNEGPKVGERRVPNAITNIIVWGKSIDTTNWPFRWINSNEVYRFQ